MIQSRELTYNGIHAEQSGQYQRAEEIYSQAVSVSPDDESARMKYAEALAKRDAIPQAIEQLEEAKRISHGDPAITIRLGQLQLANGNWRSAVASADAAIALDRKLAGAWALKGDVFAAHNKDRDALTHYLRALTCKKDNPEIQVKVAQTYMKLGQYQRALSNLDLVCHNCGRGKESEQVVLLQCTAYNALERQEESVALLSNVIAQEDASPTAWHTYREALAATGDIENARLAMQAAANRFPDDQRFAESLAEVQQASADMPLQR